MLFEAFIMSECFTRLNWVLWPLGLILCALALWLRTKHAKGVLGEFAGNHAGRPRAWHDALAFRGRSPETNYDLRFMNYDFQLTSSNQHPTTARQGS